MRGTIFCDVDGTLVKHDDLTGSHPQEWLPGAKEKLQSWCERCAVVLTTSRVNTDSLSAFLIREGVTKNIMILNQLPLGPRYLINDRSWEGQDQAFAINVDRNQGLEHVDLG